MNTSFLSFLHQIEIIKRAQPHQIEIIGVVKIRQSIVKNKYVPAKPVIYTGPSDRQIAPVRLAYIYRAARIYIMQVSYTHSVYARHLPTLVHSTKEC